MPHSRPLLSVPCDTHGLDACPSDKGCANRRARAGLPPAASGTTGAERNRRAGPMRDLRRGCAAAEDVRAEDVPEALELLNTARRVVRRKMKEKG